MTELSWNAVDEEVVYSCEGFDVVHETVRLPDGESSAFDYVSLSESVVVLPLTPSGNVVVIEEWREAVKRVNRGVPAGDMEPGEDRDEAARRELREETGYEAGSLDHLTTVEPANGFSDAVYHYFVAHQCEATAEQDLDADERIRVETATLDDLVEAAREGELRDGRSALAVLYYGLFEVGDGLPSW